MAAGNHHDVIMIGAGAGGGTLLYALAHAGKRILVLERGDFVPREKDNWSSHAVNVEAKYNTKEIGYDKDGEELHAHTNYFVGGNTARNLFIGQRIPLAGVAHQNGTIRFGRDPKTPALDPFCKAWDLDNLYVVDSSFFVSSAAVNPALTILANALRVADHLHARLQ